MNSELPRSGYTLPVFACASAIAALRHLHNEIINDTVSLDLIDPPKLADISIQQVAKITENTALGITISDPGDNLDLTRNTPIWALVELAQNSNNEQQITIQGGEGIGKQINHDNKDAIYSYAQQLLQKNLIKYLNPTESIKIIIILPEGRSLAKRTSNQAFGVVEGLSLLGTTGISQPLSAPSQLAIYQKELEEKAQQFDSLVFCIGENGLDLARKQGINPEQLIKTANWLGPLLVTAGLQKIRHILLFGYHGKLIKVAGGIFHTHHHLADGRLEILVAHSAKVGLQNPILQQIFDSATTEDGLKLLRKLDQEKGSHWTQKIYQSIAQTIDKRAQDYIRNHAEMDVCVGSILFDRDRSIIISSQQGKIIKHNLLIDHQKD